MLGADAAAARRHDFSLAGQKITQSFCVFVIDEADIFLAKKALLLDHNYSNIMRIHSNAAEKFTKSPLGRLYHLHAIRIYRHYIFKKVYL